MPPNNHPSSPIFDEMVHACYPNRSDPNVNVQNQWSPLFNSIQRDNELQELGILQDCPASMPCEVCVESLDTGGITSDANQKSNVVAQYKLKEEDKIQNNDTAQNYLSFGALDEQLPFSPVLDDDTTYSFLIEEDRPASKPEPYTEDGGTPLASKNSSGTTESLAIQQMESISSPSLSRSRHGIIGPSTRMTSTNAPSFDNNLREITELLAGKRTISPPAASRGHGTIARPSTRNETQSPPTLAKSRRELDELLERKNADYLPSSTKACREIDELLGLTEVFTPTLLDKDRREIDTLLGLTEMDLLASLELFSIGTDELLENKETIYPTPNGRRRLKIEELLNMDTVSHSPLSHEKFLGGRQDLFGHSSDDVPLLQLRKNRETNKRLKGKESVPPTSHRKRRLGKPELPKPKKRAFPSTASKGHHETNERSIGKRTASIPSLSKSRDETSEGPSSKVSASSLSHEGFYRGKSEPLLVKHEPASLSSVTKTNLATIGPPIRKRLRFSRLRTTIQRETAGPSQPGTSYRPPETRYESSDLPPVPPSDSKTCRGSTKLFEGRKSQPAPSHGNNSVEKTNSPERKKTGPSTSRKRGRPRGSKNVRPSSKRPSRPKK